MKSPRTITLFAFRDSFLALRKLVWQLAKKECFVMTFIADVKVSLYSSQVDVTVTSETLSVYNVLPPFCREGGGGVKNLQYWQKGDLHLFNF